MVLGTKGSGQGHETMYKQMLFSMLGIDTDDATFVDGDTAQIGEGNDVRLTIDIYGRSALRLAADQVIEKGKVIASHVLEASAGDIEFDKGDFTIGGTDRSVSIQEIAKIAHTLKTS